MDNTPGWLSHSQLWDTVTDNGMAWKCKSDTGWTKHDVFMQWHDLIYCYWMNKYSDNGDKAFGFVTNDSHNIELLTGSSQWTDELQYASANWRKGHEYWSLSSTSTATATFSDFTGAGSTHSSCIRMMLKTVVLIQLWTSFLLSWWTLISHALLFVLTIIMPIQSTIPSFTPLTISTLSLKSKVSNS